MKLATKWATAGMASGIALTWLYRQMTWQPGLAPVGGTAVITGASSGIGKDFAHALAAQGFDLVLVARRKERLEQLARELSRQHGISAEAYPADLTEPEEVRGLVSHVQEIQDLTLLVNNAGFGLNGFFWEQAIQEQEAMIRLHVEATVRLAHAVLPQMLNRGHGAVVNVSSVAGLAALPMNNTYSSTKAYLINFSESLAYELRGTGVQVQALCPGFTRSEFHDTPAYEAGIHDRYPSFMWLQAADVVRESLETLQVSGPVVVIPGRLYRFLALVLRSGALKPFMPLARQFLPE